MSYEPGNIFRSKQLQHGSIDRSEVVLIVTRFANPPPFEKDALCFSDGLDQDERICQGWKQ